MGTAIFPTGTKTVFQQTTAPTGWTKDISNDDYTLRIVTGTGGGIGGSQGFSTVMANVTFSGTIGPSADPTVTTFSINSGNTAAGVPDHYHNVSTNFLKNWSSSVSATTNLQVGSGIRAINSPSGPYSSDAVGGGGTHNHFLEAQTNFAGGTRNFSVRYIDMIAATID